MEHEGDADTNWNWYARYGHQSIGTGTGGLGNKRTGGDNPNYSVIKNDQNIEKIPGDLKMLHIDPGRTVKIGNAPV